MRRRRPSLDTISPVARQIIIATTNRARARRLLTLSDDALLACHRDLVFACDHTGFSDGAGYIHQRVAALCATRDATGRLDAAEATTLEFYRVGLAAVAGGRT